VRSLDEIVSIIRTNERLTYSGAREDGGPGELIRRDDLRIRCSEVLIENGILMVTLRCTKDSSQEKINWKTVGFVPVFKAVQ